jgi:hypothetical protein
MPQNLHFYEDFDYNRTRPSQKNNALVAVYGRECYSMTVNAIRHFPVIPLPLPLERIFRRLGYRAGVTDVTPALRKEIERAAHDAHCILDVQGRGRIVRIVKTDGEKMEFEGGRVITSNKVSQFLIGIEQVLFLAATGGVKIMEAMKNETDHHHLDRAAVFDAVASEVVDDALGWMMEFFQNELRAGAQTVTSRRYSCGYGDFAVSNQQIFFDLLELEKIGLKLTASYLIVPEKSVTALAGIEAIR